MRGSNFYESDVSNVFKDKHCSKQQVVKNSKQNIYRRKGEKLNEQTEIKWYMLLKMHENVIT